MIVLPAVVEAFEAPRTETNAGCRGKIKVARIEEIKEAVLQHFGPDFEVLRLSAWVEGTRLQAEADLKVGATRRKTTHDSVGDVSNT